MGVLVFNFGGGAGANLLLNGVLKSGRLAHAYLFCGEEFIGKRIVARNFAMAVFCQDEMSKPCFKCGSCSKFLNHNYIDYYEIAGDEGFKMNNIEVSQIRQLVFDAYVKPVEGQFKVFLINRVDKFLPAAANAILKLLEEPPKNVILMLTAVNRLNVLKTIASRCVWVNVVGEGVKFCSSFVKENYGEFDESSLKQAVVFSEGSVEKVKLILKNSDWKIALTLANSLFDAYISKNRLKFAQFVAKIEQNSGLIFLIFKFFSVHLNLLIKQKVKSSEELSFNFLEEVSRVLESFERVKLLILKNCSLKLALTELCCDVFFN